MPNLLIAGDSFAADYTVKYPDQLGWPNMLDQSYSVTNVAQAAVTEYKILQQIKSADLNKYDSIIVAHASPNRVHCERHPIHFDDPLHKSADLMYNDLLNHPDNEDAVAAVNYFEKFFELTYYSDISTLLCLEIANILGNYPHLNQLHLVNYYNHDPYDFLPDSFNYNKIWFKNQGLMNHFDDKGNKQMAEAVLKRLSI